MTLPVWPSTLPQAPLREGYTLEADPALVVSEMEGGSSRQRRRYSTEVSAAPVSYLMTSAQYATFHTFWSTTLGQGAASFTLPVWNGAAFTGKTCQITGGKFSAVPVGLHMQVGFQIKVIG